VQIQPLPKKILMQQAVRQLLVLRLLKYHLDSSAELMKNEPKERVHSFGGFRHSPFAKTSPVPAPEVKPAGQKAVMSSEPTAPVDFETSSPLSVKTPILSTHSKPVSSHSKRRHRYAHIRIRRGRRRTFSNRYLWKVYLRRCRERFLYKQLGRVSRHAKEQYGRLLARYSLYHLRRSRHYEREAARLQRTAKKQDY